MQTNNPQVREEKAAATPDFSQQLEILDGFECPILKEMMSDPVIALDGHSYERSAIQEWFRTRNKSPMTGAPLASRVLLPNHSLRKAIEDFLERMPDLAAMIQMQQQHRDLMFAIKLCEEDLQARQEKLQAQGEIKQTPEDIRINQEQLSQQQSQRASNTLGRKVIDCIDAMAIHIRTTTASSDDAALLLRTISYVSTIVRVLSKGSGEYNRLIGNSENESIPQSLMQDFIVPYIRNHGLLALMEHADFARRLSIDLSYVAVGKKDFSTVRATFSEQLQTALQDFVGLEGVATGPVSSSSLVGSGYALLSPSRATTRDTSSSSHSTRAANNP